jgi:hypothetical protein
MFKEKFKLQISHLTKEGILANLEKSHPISREQSKVSSNTEVKQKFINLSIINNIIIAI